MNNLPPYLSVAGWSRISGEPSRSRFLREKKEPPSRSFQKKQQKMGAQPRRTSGEYTTERRVARSH